MRTSSQAKNGACKGADDLSSTPRAAIHNWREDGRHQLLAHAAALPGTHCDQYTVHAEMVLGRSRPC